MISSLYSHCRVQRWKFLENQSTVAEVVGNEVPGRFLMKHSVVSSPRDICLFLILCAHVGSKNLGDAGAPPHLGGGMWLTPRKTLLLTCYFVAVGQTVWVYGGSKSRQTLAGHGTSEIRKHQIERIKGIGPWRRFALSKCFYSSYIYICFCISYISFCFLVYYHFAVIENILKEDIKLY